MRNTFSSLEESAIEEDFRLATADLLSGTGSHSSGWHVFQTQLAQELTPAAIPIVNQGAIKWKKS